MKDAQMTGKGDWSLKNQLEETRKRLEESEKDRKRIQTKLKGDLTVLGKRLAEVTQEKKDLVGKIAQIERSRADQALQSKLREGTR